MPNPFDHVMALPNQVEQMAEVRRMFAELYETLSTLPTGHQRGQALLRLEEAAMWANKSITHYERTPK